MAWQMKGMKKKSVRGKLGHDKLDETPKPRFK